MVEKERRKLNWNVRQRVGQFVRLSRHCSRHPHWLALPSGSGSAVIERENPHPSKTSLDGAPISCSHPFAKAAKKWGTPRGHNRQ